MRLHEHAAGPAAARVLSTCKCCAAGLQRGVHHLTHHKHHHAGHEGHHHLRHSWDRVKKAASKVKLGPPC